MQRSFDIKVSDREKENYPSLLQKISNPPKIIYFRGQLPEKEKCFAIVGTRRCSEYGKRTAFSLAKELTSAGLTIVSGLARGIDSFSHQGALAAQGKTIAVLGTGIDDKTIYPRENLNLAKKILAQGGCLLSEYPPGTRGTQFSFPQRNRIISGLSLGTLVVEAKSKSGALITADWTKKQKRKLFAVPGSIYSENSKGCNQLIKKGAKLVEGAGDILQDLGLPKLQKSISPKPNNKIESLIIEVLKSKSLQADKIIEKTNLPPQIVSATLSFMEIEGKVKNIGQGFYALQNSHLF